MTGGLWFLLASLFLVLAILRSGDFQQPALDWLRAVAREGNWYDARQAFQISAILIIAALGAGALAAIRELGRGQSGRLRGALAICGFLVGFYALRSISFHPIDSLIYTNRTGHALSGALEVGATVLLALAAASESRRGSARS